MFPMTDSLQAQLHTIFNAYQAVRDTSIRAVCEKCAIKTFSKNELIAKEGKTDPFEYFLLDGILHSFSVTPDFDQVTTRIFPARSVVTPHIVRTSDTKSLQNLACLQDAVAALIPVDDFSRLMREYPDLNAFGHKVVERELMLKTQRELALLTLPAKERLLRFRNEYPNLENLIPLTVISGFLGITPVSLSRLRNELANSKT